MTRFAVCIFFYLGCMLVSIQALAAEVLIKETEASFTYDTKLSGFENHVISDFAHQTNLQKSQQIVNQVLYSSKKHTKKTDVDFDGLK